MTWILIPLIAACIGWLTNYIAIKMLFRPKHKVRILGITFQGIFPKRQAEIAEKIARLVGEELISSEDIKNKIRQPNQMQFITQLIESKIDEYLNFTFPSQYPISSVLFGSKRKMKIKEDLLLEVEKAAPDVVDQYLLQIENQIKIEEIVEQKILNFSPDTLEKLILSVLRKEFRFIEAMGAVIGFLIGLFQVFIAQWL